MPDGDLQAEDEAPASETEEEPMSTATIDGIGVYMPERHGVIELHELRKHIAQKIHEKLKESGLDYSVPTILEDAKEKVLDAPTEWDIPGAKVLRLRLEVGLR